MQSQLRMPLHLGSRHHLERVGPRIIIITACPTVPRPYLLAGARTKAPLHFPATPPLLGHSRPRSRIPHSPLKEVLASSAAEPGLPHEAVHCAPSSSLACRWKHFDRAVSTSSS